MCALVLSAACAVAARAGEEHLPRADWPEVRNAATVLALPQLRRIVAEFDTLVSATILIRYPGGDLGNAWAFEVRDWLVSLGVASAHIVLEPGSGTPDTLVIRVDGEGG